MFNEGNQIHNFMSSSCSGSVINYGSGSDFLTSYGSGSGSTSQKVTVPTVLVPQHCCKLFCKIFTFTSTAADAQIIATPLSSLFVVLCAVLQSMVGKVTSFVSG
jgi:hypothetical protein